MQRLSPLRVSFLALALLHQPLFFFNGASSAQQLYLVGGLAPDASCGVFEFSLAGVLTPVPNSSSPACGLGPSFMALSPSGAFAWAANAGGGVTSIGVSIGGTVTLTTLGYAPCDDAAHIAVDRTGRWLFAASYNKGSLSVLPVSAGGIAGVPSTVLPLGANAHETVIDATGRFLFVPLLGEDAIAQVAFTAASGAAVSNPSAASCAVPAGCGPRNMLFHPTLALAYVLCELNSSIVPLAYAAATGTLSAAAPPLQVVTTLANIAPLATTQAAAAIMISADGRFLYASNRAAPFGTGNNNIAMFSIAAATGALTSMGWVDGNGGGGTIVFPRFAALSYLPRNPFLLVANQNAGTLTVFARDYVTGNLSYVGFAFSEPITAPSYMGPLLSADR